jgi:hypothetical protein
MARSMQKKEQERMGKQRELQFKLLTKQWDEMIKSKDEIQ